MSVVGADSAAVVVPEGVGPVEPAAASAAAAVDSISSSQGGALAAVHDSALPEPSSRDVLLSRFV
eukprot:CAMPEP_0196186572 /NCGR_PEP_ID=MMETSP0911-20130528/38674_1 /TAXON_ID=49265 /ORGANISM="Thalassiosira rotula, Strain GSO102" /LENGTH=64 /DNA_ID=CAMNT_0041457423 /DNA_START=537 /DNA_END=731 /DNA_ORIENTATION=-